MRTFRVVSRRRPTLLLCAAIALGLIAPVAEATPAPRNLAAGLGYHWSAPPDATRPDRGQALTDGRLGRLDVTDPAWVGHTGGKTREIVIDLGAPKSITRIEAHFLQDWPTSSVLVPLTTSMSVAARPGAWSTVADRATQLLWGDGPPRDEWYAWDSAAASADGGSYTGVVYARYVKISFSVHTQATQLIDEIRVLGTDGHLDGAKLPPPDVPAYLRPGAATGGIQDLALIYNGHYEGGRGNWSADRLLPYLGYVDPGGRPNGRLFDGVLMLGLRTPEGRDLGTGEGRKSDWEWYRDKTFAVGGDLDELNRAAEQLAQRLNRPELTVKVVLTIPSPGGQVTDFGDVDGDGITENVNAGSVGRDQAFANQEKIVRWWTGEITERWGQKAYPRLQLAGLYWLPEQIEVDETGPKVARMVTDVIDEQGLKSFWIPHFLAYKSYLWSEVGFDAAAFQPNYFFEPMGPERIEDAAGIAQRYGMGMEIEFDEQMLTDPVFRERFRAYLDGGDRFGYGKRTFTAYYQGVDTVHQAATSKDPAVRRLYDELAAFVRGGRSLTG